MTAGSMSGAGGEGLLVAALGGGGKGMMLKLRCLAGWLWSGVKGSAFCLDWWPCPRSGVRGVSVRCGRRTGDAAKVCPVGQICG